MAWYQVVIECSGVPTKAGLQGSKDITKNFARRPWHQGATCKWDGKNLRMTAENDFDAAGIFLQNEFSDEVSACIGGGCDDLRVISITDLSPDA